MKSQNCTKIPAMNQPSDGNDNLLLLEYGNSHRMEGTGLFLIWRQINEDFVV